MKLRKSAARYGSVVLALAAHGQLAHADEVSGLYIGGSVGRAQIDTDNALYQSQLESSVEGFGSLDWTDASLSKRRTAWWVNAGYMVWPYVGIEASYLHFGQLVNQVVGTYTPVVGNVENVYAETLLSSDGPALGFLFRLPLVEHFDINFRLADYYGRSGLTNTLIAATTETATETKHSSSLLLGLGVAYTIGAHWSAKIDYLRVQNAQISSASVSYNVDMVSAGVAYTF
jgi:opacity protein-like surface antigen